MNGENASPLYKFLKKGKWGIFGDEIQWNFAKFLVDKNGQAVERYYPTTSPLTLEVMKPSLSVSEVLIPEHFFYSLCAYVMSSCFFLQHDIKKLLNLS